MTREAAALLTSAAEARRIDRGTLGDLPAPVRRYLMKAVGRREQGIRTDQGALLRLIGEMTWFPSAFLDDRYVRWSAIDDHRATATLTVSGHAVSGEFAFGPDDLPITFSAERYRDVGGGQAMLTPFRGQSTDFRDVGGMLVPHRMVAAWQVGDHWIEYVRFEIEHLEYDVNAPF